MKSLLVAVMTVTLGATLAASVSSEPKLYAFWPRFAPPSTLIPLKPLRSADDAIPAQTLAGLVARRARRGGPREALWLETSHPAYQRWLRMKIERSGCKLEPAQDFWDLVRRYRDAGLVKGYLLYREDRSDRPLHQDGPLDVSANLATSLCGSFGAIAVPEGAESKAIASGLTRLLDTRGMTEEECFDRYQSRFNPRTLALQDPKVATTRAEAIALDAFMLTRPGPLYERVLKWCEPGRPVLGWGVGDENKITSPVSRWGNFITSTDWCQNLPALAESPTVRPKPLRRPAGPPLDGIWSLPWERDVHYAAFVMSDGDNVQWLMGDFLDARERSWWGSPDRGKVPLGWTTCSPDLAQLSPYTLDYLADTATPRDDFLCFSGGYYYPDEFGINRQDKGLLRRHAERINGYLQEDGQRLLTVNMQKWDSPAAHAAYSTYARAMPSLAGVFAIQYAPYAAGKGSVHWTTDGPRSIPVISPRFALWGRSSYEQDGGPLRVARMLNAQAFRGEPVNDAHFSWVIVHCWSWFRRPNPGEPERAEEVAPDKEGSPGTARGVTPVRWCVEALAPHVRVVKPTNMTLLLRLRTRPKETLTLALEALSQQAGTRKQALGQIAEARRLIQEGRFEQAHRLGRAIEASLTGTPSGRDQ